MPNSPETASKAVGDKSIGLPTELTTIVPRTCKDVQFVSNAIPRTSSRSYVVERFYLLWETPWFFPLSTVSLPSYL